MGKFRLSPVQKQTPDTVYELRDDLRLVQNDHMDCHGELRSEAFPSPVSIVFSPMTHLYFLSADWSLPKPLSDASYTTVSELLKDVQRHLTPDKIGKVSKAEARQEAEVVRSFEAKEATQVNSYDADGMHIKEEYFKTKGNGHDLCVTFVSPHFPQPLICLRRSNEQHLRFQDHGDLPPALMGAYTSPKDAREAILKHIQAKAKA